jgi:hypothetical protein
LSRSQHTVSLTALSNKWRETIHDTRNSLTEKRKKMTTRLYILTGALILSIAGKIPQILLHMLFSINSIQLAVVSFLFPKKKKPQFDYKIFSFVCPNNS